MFELTVSIAMEKHQYIDELDQMLSAEIKRDGGVSAKVSHGGRSSFAFAIPMQKKEYYKSKIFDHIVFIIIDDYKFNFFKESIRPYARDVIFLPFLKAISIFDADADREFISEQIEFNGEILVDSFYFFKLQPLIFRWERTANIINQNQILQSRSSMIEVLKYLTEISDSIAGETNIVVGKNQLMLKSPMAYKRFRRNYDGQIGFFTELIKLNPSKINISGKGSDEFDDVIDTVSKIFTDKIFTIN